MTEAGRERRKGLRSTRSRVARAIVIRGKSGQWIVEETFGSKDEAIAHAKQVAKLRSGRGLRVQAEAANIKLNPASATGGASSLGQAKAATDGAKTTADAAADVRAAVVSLLGTSDFSAAVIGALSARIAAIPEADLRVTDDESADEVAARFVASKRARNDWDDAVGPFLDTAGVIAWAGLGNRQNVSNAAERGDILSLPVGNRRLYPRFQFSETGQLLPHLRELMSILAVQMENPWTQALWLNTPVPLWEGLKPAEMLHRGDEERVLELARADIERRAH